MKQYDELTAEEKAVLEKLLDWYESEKEKKPKTVWDLEDGDIFWFASLFGEVKSEEWREWTIDRETRSQGNVFLTKEEAEFESKRREITTILKKYSRPFISGKENYCIAFSTKENSIEFPWCDDYKYNDLYFDDEVVIGEAIEEVGNGDYNKGEELVIKYYLGVTE